MKRHAQILILLPYYFIVSSSTTCLFEAIEDVITELKRIKNKNCESGITPVLLLLKTEYFCSYCRLRKIVNIKME